MRYVPFALLALAVGLILLHFSQLKCPVGPNPKPEKVAHSAKDVDLLVRTLWGEALHEPRLGQVAVVWVVLNRLKKNPYGWRTLGQVVTACGHVKRGRRSVKICQFEPWLTRSKELKGLSQNSISYKAMASVVADVLQGRTVDPTKGAWYFLNKNTVASRRKSQGRKMPKWARNCVDIGRHSFCKG